MAIHLITINFFGITLVFVLLILLSAAMFFFVIRKKHAQRNKLDAFSMNVHNALINKSPEEKLSALQQLIERIENDGAYQKMPDWKDKVLVKVYEHLTAVHHAMGNELGAIEACSRIIELDTSNGMAYYNRASMYGNLKEYKKALADFDEAAALMPFDANVYNNRGWVYNNLGKPEEALTDFNYAIRLAPTAIAHFNRANLYYEQNIYTEAKQDYLKCLELDPDNRHGLKDYAEEAANLNGDEFALVDKA
jgi:tetratricopeptide (TPR) repeat protein